MYCATFMFIGLFVNWRLYTVVSGWFCAAGLVVNFAWIVEGGACGVSASRMAVVLLDYRDVGCLLDGCCYWFGLAVNSVVYFTSWFGF